MLVSAIAVVGISSSFIQISHAFVPSLPPRVLLSRTKLSTTTIDAPLVFYKNETMGSDAPTDTPTMDQPASSGSLADLCPFKKVMAANRAEIGENLKCNSVIFIFLAVVVAHTFVSHTYQSRCY